MPSPIKTIISAGTVLLAACGVGQEPLSDISTPDSSSDVGAVQAASHQCLPATVVGGTDPLADCFNSAAARSDAELVCLSLGTVLTYWSFHDPYANCQHGEATMFRYTCCTPH